MTSKPWAPAVLLAAALLVGAAQHSQHKFSQLRKVSLAGGITLHYAERGRGEPIIFIHGASADYRVWERWLAEFPENYRVIAYSRRYNYPNDNEVRKNHSAAVDAEDLAAFTKQLGLGKVHVVGHSYGGCVALIYALKHPDEVLTLTLAEPPVFTWLADLPGEGAKEGKAIFESSQRQFRLAREALVAGDKEKAFSYQPFGLSSATPAARRQQIMDNAREIEALVTTDDEYAIDREVVKKVKTPTLLLEGSKIQKDARGLWLVMQELERLIPTANRERAIISGAGHLMWLDQAKACNEALLEFLKNADGGAVDARD
jgi:pimeloyl-ACP methyl ester carboxylesterase